MAGQHESEPTYRAQDFVADGSLRDVCVLGTALDDWQHMFDGLPGRYVLTWTLADTTETGIPEASAVWSKLQDDPEESASLAIEIDGIWFTSYFFEIEEIEFTFDPSDVVDEETFAPVRDFVKWLGNSTGREVVVTMEGNDHASMPALLRWTP